MLDAPGARSLGLVPVVVLEAGALLWAGRTVPDARWEDAITTVAEPLDLLLRHPLLTFAIPGIALVFLRRRVLQDALSSDGPAFTKLSLVVAAHLALFAAALGWTLDRAMSIDLWFHGWIGLTGAWLVSCGLVYVASRVPLRTFLGLCAMGAKAAMIFAVAATAANAVGDVAAGLWDPLAPVTLALVHGILGCFFSDVVVDPGTREIGTSSFTVQILPGCAGYEGMGLMLGWLAAYLVAFRGQLRFPRVLWLVPVGLALMWTTNAFRIAALIAVGDSWSADVAMGGFHSNLGWVVFCTIALGIVLIAHRSTVFSRTSRAPVTARSAAAPFLVPFLALLATVMLTGLASSGFDWLYPLRFVVVGVALIPFLTTYRTWSWSWSWSAVAIGVVVYAEWIALEPAAGATSVPAALATLPRAWALSWIVFRVLGSVITVPFAEELAFRGFLPWRLRGDSARDVVLGDARPAPNPSVPDTGFHVVSLVVPSILFGLLHGRFVAGTLAGVAFGLIRHRRGLPAAILAHATANALIAAHVLLGGRWSLWS